MGFPKRYERAGETLPAHASWIPDPEGPRPQIYLWTLDINSGKRGGSSLSFGQHVSAILDSRRIRSRGLFAGPRPRAPFSRVGPGRVRRRRRRRRRVSGTSLLRGSPLRASRAGPGPTSGAGVAEEAPRSGRRVGASKLGSRPACAQGRGPKGGRLRLPSVPRPRCRSPRSGSPFPGTRFREACHLTHVPLRLGGARSRPGGGPTVKHPRAAGLGAGDKSAFRGPASEATPPAADPRVQGEAAPGLAGEGAEAPRAGVVGLQAGGQTPRPGASASLSGPVPPPRPGRIASRGACLYPRRGASPLRREHRPARRHPPHVSGAPPRRTRSAGLLGGPRSSRRESCLRRSSSRRSRDGRGEYGRRASRRERTGDAGRDATRRRLRARGQ